uniref:Uncharacterized protein MANES_14G085000 n=1 Tax=Rhizophora mucronata TaxID=61149 RepID=A0A2P2KYI6_RHIMU
MSRLGNALLGGRLLGIFCHCLQNLQCYAWKSAYWLFFSKIVMPVGWKH